MSDSSNELQVSPSQPGGALQHGNGAFSGNMQTFEDAQRIAGALAKSTLVPRDYQNNVANCMIAMEMAQRVNANPMACMQNLHIIHGRPSWSSSFIIAILNGCGRFSAIRFEMHGGPQELDSWGCRAYATELSTGDRIEGPWVSIKMAKAEGWYGKSGSKWKTMPDLMLRYRSAAFFGRLYAPDLLMGMHSEDEVSDFGGRRANADADARPTAGFNPAKPPADEPRVVEGELLESEPDPQPQEFNVNKF